jgi:hypothetical protein
LPPASKGFSKSGELANLIYAVVESLRTIENFDKSNPLEIEIVADSVTVTARTFVDVDVFS